MKILYLSPGNRMDYQSDMLLHGLRTLHGADVVDIARVNHLYQDYGDVSTLYGRGFTLTKLLDPALPIDRTLIPERIINRYFDLIIYGSICRDVRYLNLVTSSYPREQILFIDGEDQPNVLTELSRHGLYFKRELIDPRPGVFPIHFAIPVSKIGTIKPTLKSQVRALSDPRDPSTYIYTSEQDYYLDYSKSLFAFTLKKAGWDSLRTLEIMANGCIPLFLDLAQCPAYTCIQLPKPELLEALSYQDHDGTYWDSEEGKSIWKSLWRRIHLRFVSRCTTISLAQYVLETCARAKSEAA
jgi:hypothetical protein